jgi:hypothetical protein
MIKYFYSNFYGGEMRLAVVQFIFVLAVLGQRFVPGPEIEKRLIVPEEQRILYSPGCIGTLTRIRLRAKIDHKGQIVSLKKAKLGSLHLGQDKSRMRRVIEQAKRLVLTTWRYRPFLVDGRPTTVTTFVAVPCVATE